MAMKTIAAIRGRIVPDFVEFYPEVSITDVSNPLYSHFEAVLGLVFNQRMPRDKVC